MSKCPGPGSLASNWRGILAWNNIEQEGYLLLELFLPVI
jgi:hypothetical protein